MWISQEIMSSHNSCNHSTRVYTRDFNRCLCHSAPSMSSCLLPELQNRKQYAMQIWTTSWRAQVRLAYMLSTLYLQLACGFHENRSARFLPWHSNLYVCNFLWSLYSCTSSQHIGQKQITPIENWWLTFLSILLAWRAWKSSRFDQMSSEQHEQWTRQELVCLCTAWCGNFARWE